jgi:hypothetical protein
MQNALFLIVLSKERNLLILKEEKTRAKSSQVNCTTQPLQKIYMNQNQEQAVRAVLPNTIT